MTTAITIFLQIKHDELAFAEKHDLKALAAVLKDCIEKTIKYHSVKIEPRQLKLF